MLYDPHNVTPDTLAATLTQGQFTSVPEESFEYSISVDYAHSKAKKLGLNVVKPDDNTLQLDFDTEEQWDTFINQRLTILLQHVKVVRVWETKSNNGNRHVYIKLAEPMDFVERIAYQAALGSDPTRELLSLARKHIGMGSTTMLFEKPNAPETLVYATDHTLLLTAGTSEDEENFEPPTVGNEVI